MAVGHATEVMPSRVDFPLERKDILVVDDNALILRSLSRILRTHVNGYDVLSAESGREAVEILNARRIALLLTDLKMPEMDGFELLAYAMKHYPSVPVLAMTGDYSPEVEARLRSLGAVHCIQKPFEREDLLEKISNKLAETNLPLQEHDITH